MNEVSKQNAVPMAPRRYSPFADVERLFDAMGHWPFSWLESKRSEPRALRAFEHMPNVEVSENDKLYSVAVELPGIDEKDTKVTVEDNVLTISGEKKVERTDDKTHYSERSYGSFMRSFTLPADADEKAVTARFAKGVLSIEIPKTARPTGKVSEVPIKGA